MEKCKVSDLVKMKVLEVPMDGNHGEIHPVSSDYADSGIPFVMASDIENSEVNYKKCKYLTKEHSLKLRKGHSIKNDVLLTHKATIGRTAVNKYEHEDHIMLTPQVTYYRIKDKEKLNHNYLKYYFDSPYFQTIIKSWAEAGSTRAYIGITKQLELPIIYPPISIQQKIAAVLASLDDKIELNNQINTELEQLAKTLYDYWFVQFEFPDKNGKPYKSSGGKMIWNEVLKREIPEGWKDGILSDIMSLEYGKPLKSEDRSGNGYPVLGSNGIVGYHSNYLVSGPGIVVGRKGSAGEVTWIDDDFYPIDTTYYVKDRFNLPNLIFYYHLLQICQLKRIESSSAVPGLNRETVYAVKIIIPTREPILDFLKIVTPLFYKIRQNKKQNQQLASLRDWLLPLLMNGQVKVD